VVKPWQLNIVVHAAGCVARPAAKDWGLEGVWSTYARAPLATPLSWLLNDPVSTCWDLEFGSSRAGRFGRLSLKVCRVLTTLPDLWARGVSGTDSGSASAAAVPLSKVEERRFLGCSCWGGLMRPLFSCWPASSGTSFSFSFPYISLIRAHEPLRAFSSATLSSSRAFWDFLVCLGGILAAAAAAIERLQRELYLQEQENEKHHICIHSLWATNSPGKLLLLHEQRSCN